MQAPASLWIPDIQTPRHETYAFHKVTPTFVNEKLPFDNSQTREEIKLKMLNVLPSKMRKRAAPFIGPALDFAHDYKVDPFWVLAVMWTESHFRKRVTSHAGASGPMQIMPQTKKYLAGLLKRSKSKSFRMDKKDYLADKSLMNNVEMGVFYLKYLLKKFNNNPTYATVAYNMGPSRTRWMLRKKMGVGKRNIYLNRVLRRYKYLRQKFSAI